MLVRPTAPQPLLSEADLPPAGPSAERGRDGLAVESARRGTSTVLKMTGPLHKGTVVTAEAEILSTIVLAPQPLNLVLDLTEVDAIDSHGVGLLAKAHFAAHAVRGVLHVVAPADSLAHRVPHLNVTDPASLRTDETEAAEAAAG
ncbi:anti-anti-sigma factor [Thermomonospora echinospora]|uniref:Anti-anti-sigma factor n=1 Tax=Thermomonospora echinospora TaxID=1992 RepID=A0A1H5YIL3_9ACTN|nr:STAS domain-containing protein [Thermomonospora echinospora]SEG23226.1 anti-anti-sigma factor [Thermomonospora echinospora]